ncbi:MAG: PAS domain S-box protein [Firmicutes bacterium]|nr:PAS domain S-box protein [Bacillota bacterium]
MSKQLIHDSIIDFQLLVDELKECVWVFDLNQKKFLYISPAVYQLRGLTVAEAMAEKLEDSLTFESLQKLKNDSHHRCQRFMDGDFSDDIVYNLDAYEQYCKDGSTKIIEISTRLKMNTETNSMLVIGVSRDITKRKLHEKKLIDTIRNQQKFINKQKLSKECKPELYLHFFGKFRVFADNNNKPIKWRTTKTEELFAFLLQKKCQYVSRDEILEALWPELELEKAIKYLHTSIYNLKKDLKSVGVSFQLELINGFYCYDEHRFYSDLGELKNLIKTFVNPYDSFDGETIQKTEQAIILYEGDYLAENDYPWAKSQSTFYRHQFEKYVFDLARHYFFKRDYISTKRVLSKLISIDNLNERYHELLLNVFLFDDDYLSFVRHYDHLKALLQNELGQLPNGSIRTMNEQYRKFAEECIKNEKVHF